MRNHFSVFIGYDPRETVAFHVLAHSIMKRAAAPVSIVGLVQSQLREQGYYTRAKDERASTEFSLTRFLVPYLSGYHGISLFLDCDMLCRADVFELLLEAYRAPKDWSVRVVQHDYETKHATKFFNQPNEMYPRKNWSSVMLFNNAHPHCRELTPEYVSTATPADLHRFVWTKDENIGALPVHWNHLVGEYEPNPYASIVHYTLGTPCIPGYENCEFGPEWFQELHEMNRAS